MICWKSILAPGSPRCSQLSEWWQQTDLVELSRCRRWSYRNQVCWSVLLDPILERFLRWDASGGTSRYLVVCLSDFWGTLSPSEATRSTSCRSWCCSPRWPLPCSLSFSLAQQTSKSREFPCMPAGLGSTCILSLSLSFRRVSLSAGASVLTLYSWHTNHSISWTPTPRSWSRDQGLSSSSWSCKPPWISYPQPEYLWLAHFRPSQPHSASKTW